MQAMIECFECRSIENHGLDLPKVEVFARVCLPMGEIGTIDKKQIAEAIQDACERHVEISKNSSAEKESTR